jgi:hypothetical protein
MQTKIRRKRYKMRFIHENAKCSKTSIAYETDSKMVSLGIGV